MIKRILAISLTLSLLITTFSGCHKEETAGETPGAVSRGQWISMLAEKFSLEQTENRPFYKDVPAESPLFPAVQSAAGWGILTVFSKDTLEADQPVRRDEAASTAAIAAGFRSDSDGKFDIKQSVSFAEKYGIVGTDSPETITEEEAAAILERALAVYLSGAGEEQAKIVVNKDVVDFSSAALTVSGNTVTAAGTATEKDGKVTAVIDGKEISEGETFISSPSPEYPFGAAFKVIGIKESGGTVTLSTEQPTLADLYEEIDLHTTVAADLNNMIWADGVSVSPSPETADMATDGDISIGLMSFGGDPPAVVPLSESGKNQGKSWSFSLGDGGKIKWERSHPGVFGTEKAALLLDSSNFIYDDLPSVADFGGSADPWEKKLEANDRYEGGYKITGTLTIQSIEVTADIQYRSPMLAPRSASLTVSSDISSSLKIEGKLLDESLEIGTLPPIPLGEGLAVCVGISLYADASGSLQLKADFSHLTRVDWQNGADLRKSQDSKIDLEAQAAIDLGFGADLSACLNAFTINVIDVGVKAGAELETEASVLGKCEETKQDGAAALHYQESAKLETAFYVPIVSLYVGSDDSLIGKIGLHGEWDIITKENGAKRYPLFSEEWVFWEETVVKEAEIPPASSDTESTTSTGSTGGTYTTRFEEIKMVTFPPFSFDYPAGWEITKEEIPDSAFNPGEIEETVELTNDRGVTVTYSQIVPGMGEYGGGGTLVAMEVSKAADSSFIPGHLQAKDYSDLGSFMVAKVQDIGHYMTGSEDMIPVEEETITFVLVPETEAGTQLHKPVAGGSKYLFTFYDGRISFVAEAPGGKFTAQEEKDVIAILSSFRNAR